MKQTTTLALACLMASFAMCGCQSVGTVARGQSPSLEHHHPSGVHQGLEQAVQDSHLSQAIENHVRGAEFDYHNTTTTYNHMVLPPTVRLADWMERFARMATADMEIALAVNVVRDITLGVSVHITDCALADSAKAAATAMISTTIQLTIIPGRTLDRGI